MTKSIGKRLGILMICSLYLWHIPAQDIQVGPNSFEAFQKIPDATERLHYFFGTTNRYTDNSAYDWQAIVNVYHNNAQKLNDTINAAKYEIIQAQLFYDIGDYSKSVAIANALYKDRVDMDLEYKRIILDLIDNNYAKLGLYDRQFEIRNRKKELDLSDKVAFYDIYSNLGLYRKAMDDYIKDMLKTLSEDDYYGQAEYQNNVGTYLLLDMSTP